MRRTVDVSPAAAGIDYSLRPRFRRPLFVLLTAAGVLLALPCVNVAGLLIARSVERRQERAIRAALGAPWSALAGDALAEGALLVGLGTAAGVLAAHATAGVLVRIFGASSATFEMDVGPNIRTLAVATATAALALIAVAAVPMRRAGRANRFDLLRLPGAYGGRDGSRLRSGLVTIQVALTLVLVAAASLFAETLSSLRSAPARTRDRRRHPGEPASKAPRQRRRLVPSGAPCGPFPPARLPRRGEWIRGRKDGFSGCSTFPRSVGPSRIKNAENLNTPSTSRTQSTLSPSQPREPS